MKGKKLKMSIDIKDKIFSVGYIRHVEGTVSIVNNGKESTRGEIIVLRTASPKYLPVLLKSSAVVCEEGSLLSHLAIVCRELGIPFIKIRDASKKLRDGDYVIIDLDEQTLKVYRS